MSKVKITKQQAEAIEELRSKRFPDSVIAHNVACDNYNSRVSRSEHDSLCEMKFDDLIKALYIGYEIEEEFKSGDWIVNNQGRVLQVTEVYLEDGNEIVEANDGQVFTYRLGAEFVRHATPDEIAEEKERRWWAKHGREVWELKQGDVLMATRRHIMEVTADPRSHRFNSYTGNDKYDFDIKECKVENWKVICFSEERVD